MTGRFLRYYTMAGLLVIVSGAIFFYYLLPGLPKYNVQRDTTAWDIPYVNSLNPTPEADLIRYGRELIIHTAEYLGPKGTVARLSNGMNCQNCHPEAGTRLNGNNFALVATTYPKFRARSGRLESVEYRINECLERSLNGSKLDSLSREMRAMRAYIIWLGSTVVKGVRLKGMGIPDLPIMNRAASVINGEHLYAGKCISCHGLSGQGSWNAEGTAYTYPPLWGPGSFNVSAGIYRLSKLAGYIKFNMPYTEVPSEPQLTDEEAWDLAAYINSQQRPAKFFMYDWPKIANKPFDFPFGPYVDSFSEYQHKYGPYTAIKQQIKNGK